MPSKWSFSWGHDTNHNAKEMVLPDFHTKKKSLDFTNFTNLSKSPHLRKVGAACHYIN
jgi:hypothetical protein